MKHNDKEEMQRLTRLKSESKGFHRRTFLKEVLAAGALTSVSGLARPDIAWTQAASPTDGRNLYQKIIGAHLGSGQMTPGAEIGLMVDSTLTQDSLGVTAYVAELWTPRFISPAPRQRSPRPSPGD